MDARIKKGKFLSIQVPLFGEYTIGLFREEKDDLEPKGVLRRKGNVC